MRETGQGALRVLRIAVRFLRKLVNLAPSASMNRQRRRQRWSSWDLTQHRPSI